MITFFKNFLKNPKQVWSIVPCTPIMINSLLDKVDFSWDLKIVEFWTWPWNFTKWILARMSKNSVLYSFEISTDLFNFSKSRISDERLFLFNDSAENILNYFWSWDVDIIISWLPLASLPDELWLSILNNWYSSLKKWWIFMQYQYFLSNIKDVQVVFWKPKLYFEICNFPPAFYYKCIK